MLLVLLYILLTCKIVHSFTKCQKDVKKIIFHDVKENMNIELPLRDKKIIAKFESFNNSKL